MKKFAVTALLFLLTFTAASATTKEESSAQSGSRTGYRGSISAHAMFNVWLGAETSHGYIFNRRHYVGGGIGASVAPIENIYVLGHIFADYRYFIMTQDSTPTLGAKAGFCTAPATMHQDFRLPGLRKLKSTSAGIGHSRTGAEYFCRLQPRSSSQTFSSSFRNCRSELNSKRHHENQ